MSVIRSTINPNSADFQANAAHMQAQVDDLNALVAEIKKGGGERYQARHKERGKLLPRERVTALVDPGSPFLEFSQLAAPDMYGDDDVPGAGSVCWSVLCFRSFRLE